MSQVVSDEVVVFTGCFLFMSSFIIKDSLKYRCGPLFDVPHMSTQTPSKYISMRLICFATYILEEMFPDYFHCLYVTFLYQRCCSEKVMAGVWTNKAKAV